MSFAVRRPEGGHFAIRGSVVRKPWEDKWSWEFISSTPPPPHPDYDSFKGHHAYTMKQIDTIYTFTTVHRGHVNLSREWKPVHKATNKSLDTRRPLRFASQHKSDDAIVWASEEEEEEYPMTAKRGAPLRVRNVLLKFREKAGSVLNDENLRIKTICAAWHFFPMCCATK